MHFLQQLLDESVFEKYKTCMYSNSAVNNGINLCVAIATVILGENVICLLI